MQLLDLSPLNSIADAIKCYSEADSDTQLLMFTAFVMFNFVAIIKLSTVPWLGLAAMGSSLYALNLMHNKINDTKLHNVVN